jgi:hypothetical protein
MGVFVVATSGAIRSRIVPQLFERGHGVIRTSRSLSWRDVRGLNDGSTARLIQELVPDLPFPFVDLAGRCVNHLALLLELQNQSAT